MWNVLEKKWTGKKSTVDKLDFSPSEVKSIPPIKVVFFLLFDSKKVACLAIEKINSLQTKPFFFAQNSANTIGFLEP